MAKVILSEERDRRFKFYIGLLIGGLIYFYEYPWYLIWKLYSSYQGWTGIGPIPPLSEIDLAFIGLLIGVLLYILFRPRHYIELNSDSINCGLYKDAKFVKQISLSNLSPIRITEYSRRRTKSKDSEFYHYIKVASKGEKDVVFLDDVRSTWLVRERLQIRSLMNKLRQLNWVDETGIINKDTVDLSQAANDTQPKKKTANKAQSKKVKVKMAHGTRAVIVLILCALAAVFYFNELKIAGIIFIVITLIVIIDWVLAVLGFGQQPDRK